MRKILLTTMLAVMACTLHAQAIETNETTQRYGYFGRNEIKWGAIGNGQAGTYHVGAFFRSSDIVKTGAKVKGIRMYFRDVTHIKDVKIWAQKLLPTSPITASSSTTSYQEIDISTLTPAGPKEALGTPYDLVFSTPHDIESQCFIGCTFTLTEASSEEDKAPVLYDSSIRNIYGSFYLWQPGEDFAVDGKVPVERRRFQSEGVLAAQLFIEYPFEYKNAIAVNTYDAEFQSFYKYHAGVLGQTNKLPIQLKNFGTEGITSLSYTLTGNGVDNNEQTITFDKKYDLIGDYFTAELPVYIAPDATTGITERTLTITKVNGQPNERTDNSVDINFAVVSKPVKRFYVVEEATGTSCDNCPRGIASVDKIHSEYSDRAICVVYHNYNSPDPMYLQTGNRLPEQWPGAPELRLNHLGSGSSTAFSECTLVPPVVADACDKLATVSVDVHGVWDSSKQTVTATATVEALTDDEFENDLDIEYLLIADGLTGSGSNWQQRNQYANRTVGYFDSRYYNVDMKPYYPGGKYGSYYITGFVFNHVALVTSYVSSVNRATRLGQLAYNTPVTNTYTLSLSSAPSGAVSVLNKDNVAVVALVVNRNREVINAAMHYLKDDYSTGIQNIQNQNEDTQAPTYYTIDGRRTTSLQKGLNIIKNADGTVTKTIIK